MLYKEEGSPQQNLTSSDRQIQNELDSLITNISLEVMNSNINKSIGEAADIFSNQLPELDSVVSRLKTESSSLYKIKSELESNITKLSNISPEVLNSKIGKIDMKIVEIERQIKKLVKLSENMEKSQSESKINLVNKMRDQEDEIQRIIKLHMSQRTSDIKDFITEEVRSIKNTMLLGFLLIGVMMFTLYL